MRILAAVVMVSVGVLISASGRALAQASDVDTPVALVITYADGRSVAPGETYTFDLAVGSTVQTADAPVSPQPLDTITITAALFEDLSLEGEAGGPLQNAMPGAARGDTQNESS